MQGGVTRALCWTAVLALALSAAAGQRLSPTDLKEAQKLAKGNFYLRVDAPCIYSTDGSSYWLLAGVVVASPSASNTDLGAAHPVVEGGAAWILRPNDPVGKGRLYYTRAGELQFDFKGLGAPPKERECLVTFTGIQALEDFQKAFDRVFSRVPLEDAHPEWPAEVGKAVAEHRVIEGMDHQQVHAVIGAPARIDTDSSEGRVVEKWYSRPIDFAIPATAAPPRTGRPQGPTEFPPVLVFLNGKLTADQAHYAPADREALLRFGTPTPATAK